MIHPIIIVRAAPPRLSFNKIVNLESLYGICNEWEERALITVPRVNKDLFILIVSLLFSFSDPVNLSLSDPAKSTNDILPLLSEPAITLALSYYILYLYNVLPIPFKSPPLPNPIL